MSKPNTYDSFTDKQLIATIVAGNEEAAIYLIYNRYYRDIRYLCRDIYGTHEYVDDLCHELYILLKGKNADWQPLASWQGLSSFRTWLNSLIRHEFLKKRPLLIGLRENKLYSEKEDESDPVESVPSTHYTPEEMMRKVRLIEAIGRLKNEEQRIVILKELQGYSHAEIADMLNRKRIAENRQKYDKNGRAITVSAAAVDVLKQRAIQQLKKDATLWI